MPTNDSGYELHLGPDRDGRFLRVQPGEEYDEPDPRPEPEPAAATTEAGSDWAGETAAQPDPAAPPQPPADDGKPADPPPAKPNAAAEQQDPGPDPTATTTIKPTSSTESDGTKS